MIICLDNINCQVSDLRDEFAYLAYLQNFDISLYKHSLNVSKICKILCLSIRENCHLYMSDDFIEQVRLGGLYHDFGKIFIPTNILFKQAELEEDEYNTIKKHVNIGQNIYSMVLNKDKKIIINCIKQHHERLNSTGYPNGIGKKDICLAGKIVAIADTYDAIKSTRCYKTSNGFKRTIKVIKGSKGLYDKRLLYCLSLPNVQRQIRKLYQYDENN